MHIPSRLAHLSITPTALCAALILTLTATATADEFHLNNTTIVRGAIQSETPDTYIVQTDVGIINIPKNNVVRRIADGTTPVEVQGDLAAAKGDTTTAVTAWQQALQTAGEGTAAATRLQEKITRASAAAQQTQANEILTLLNQAKIMVENQQLDGAEAALDRLQTRGITDDAITSQIKQLEAQVHYGRGTIARDAVQLERARQEFEMAISNNPDFYPAYLELGEMLLDNSETATRGLDLLEQGLRVGGNNVAESRRYEILYRMAERYTDTRNYAQAANTYALLIPARERFPAYADALDRAVDAYVRTGEENMNANFHQTVTTLNSALQLNPNNEKALFLLGRIYLDMGQLENAVITLQRLAQINATYPQVNLHLGQAYNRIHDHETALRHLSREISLNGNSYIARLERAEAYINTTQHDKAEQDLATARQLEPEGWMAWYLTGLLEYERGNYTAAQEQLMQAIRRNRSAIPVMVLMGRVLHQSNQTENAQEWLTRVVERLQREPQLGYTYNRYLAEALTRLGEIAVQDRSPRQAEEHLSRALQVDPSYPLALSTSGDALLLMSSDTFATSPQVLQTRAEELYKRAIQLEPNEADHYLKLARYYHQYGQNPELARENYNQYVDKGGRDQNVNGWLVEVGGTPRDEITQAVRAAAAAVTLQPGMTITTATATMTTGTQPEAGMFPGTQPSTPGTEAPTGMTLTTSTVTGVVPAQPGAPTIPQTATMQSASPTGETTAAITHQTTPTTTPATAAPAITTPPAIPTPTPQTGMQL